MLPDKNVLASMMPLNPSAFGPLKLDQGQSPQGAPQGAGFNAEQYLLNKVMELKRNRGMKGGALSNLMASMPMQNQRGTT
tara:strand:- start:2110 stop:2349 length:240 start_codon:yes stop_codon:yes gene_type:complete